MPIYKGNNEQKDLYIGSTKISKIYNGNQLLYKSNPTWIFWTGSFAAGRYYVYMSYTSNSNLKQYIVNSACAFASTASDLNSDCSAIGNTLYATTGSTHRITAIVSATLNSLVIEYKNQPIDRTITFTRDSQYDI